MEVPIQPEHVGRPGLTKSNLTIIYLAVFFGSIIAMMAFYVFYVQWFIDLLTPAYGFDKAFEIVTWFTPIAWLIIANLLAIVLLYLTPLVFPLKDDAKKMLYGDFTRSMLLAIILCLISLIFLDIVAYIVNKDLKIVELVPLLLLAIWFYIYKKR
jgi:magnesium-transporting ATPase (P-type)